jgi:hypothetical protein
MGRLRVRNLARGRLFRVLSTLSASNDMFQKLAIHLI